MGERRLNSLGDARFMAQELKSGPSPVLSPRQPAGSRDQSKRASTLDGYSHSMTMDEARRAVSKMTALDQRGQSKSQSIMLAHEDVDELDEDIEAEREGGAERQRVSKQSADTSLPMQIELVVRETAMPRQGIKTAAALFMQFAKPQDAPLLQMNLDKTSFQSVMCIMCDVDNAEDLCPELVKTAFETCDRDHGGEIDIKEFVIWHAANCFNMNVCVPKETQAVRALAAKHGLTYHDIERYQVAYKKFDADGSGLIEFDEFTNLLNKLLKIPKGQSLPKERVKNLWMKADADGSGEIDFEEFVVFYMQYFDDREGSQSDPLLDFYQSNRPTQVASKPKKGDGRYASKQ
jgi:Ca2+-binding EF-hand superfamily protein